MREWTRRHEEAGVDIARVDNVARRSKGGQRGSGQGGTKKQGWTTQEWTTREWLSMSSERVRQCPIHQPIEESCEVCLTAPRQGFALVPCGHARFCESCALRVAELNVGCPVCRAQITMVMRLFQ